MLILASQSPRRRDLLESIDVEFKIIVSKYEEDHDIETDPTLLAKAHAKGKAEEVYNRLLEHTDEYVYRENDVVLGVDTLVDLAGEILGKPSDMEDARKMLKKMSGKTHKVISVLHFIRIRDGIVRTHVETTYVTFKPLTDAEINEYLQGDEWGDKAAAYAIQGGAGTFVKEIKGDFSNVVGLPLESFSTIYKELI